jgi:nitrogen fixation/metabolism regulation signal transduction histidine kinase
MRAFLLCQEFRSFMRNPVKPRLGLANVKRVVELHGGSVSLESTPQQGGCFIVTLPA